MKRPIESDYTSHVAYARALEEYCDTRSTCNTQGEHMKEALKLALEALENIYHGNTLIVVQYSTIKAIREALAAPVQELVTHTINSTGTAAVATDYYWIPIDANTPRGVKLQLLGQGGVAQYSNYHGDAFWSHWAPLPKRKAE